MSKKARAARSAGGGGNVMGDGKGNGLQNGAKGRRGAVENGDGDEAVFEDILVYIRETEASEEPIPLRIGGVDKAKVLPQLFKEVHGKRGGFGKVEETRGWSEVRVALGLPNTATSNVDQLRRLYKRFLLGYERERDMRAAGVSRFPANPAELAGHTLKIRLSNALGSKFVFRWGLVLGYDADDGEHDVLLDDENLVKINLEDLEVELGPKAASFEAKKCPTPVAQLQPPREPEIKLDPAALDLTYQNFSQRKRTRNTVDPCDSTGEYNRPMFDGAVYIGSWSEPGKRAKHRKLLDVKERLTSGHGIHSEVIKCACGLTKDIGAMVECSVCRCWSHTCCLGIDDEETAEIAKSEYRCFLCGLGGLKPDSLAHQVAQAIHKVRSASKWDDVPTKIRRAAKLPHKKVAVYRGGLAEESENARSRRKNPASDAQAPSPASPEESTLRAALAEHLARKGLNPDDVPEAPNGPPNFYEFVAGIRSGGGDFYKLTPSSRQHIWSSALRGGDESSDATEKALKAIYEKYLADFMAELDGNDNVAKKAAADKGEKEGAGEDADDVQAETTEATVAEEAATERADEDKMDVVTSDNDAHNDVEGAAENSAPEDMESTSAPPTRQNDGAEITTAGLSRHELVAEEDSRSVAEDQGAAETTAPVTDELAEDVRDPKKDTTEEANEESSDPKSATIESAEGDDPKSATVESAEGAELKSSPVESAEGAELKSAAPESAEGAALKSADVEPAAEPVQPVEAADPAPDPSSPANEEDSGGRKSSSEADKEPAPQEDELGEKQIPEESAKPVATEARTVDREAGTTGEPEDAEKSGAESGPSDDAAHPSDPPKKEAPSSPPSNKSQKEAGGQQADASAGEEDADVGTAAETIEAEEAEQKPDGRDDGGADDDAAVDAAGAAQAVGHTAKEESSGQRTKLERAPHDSDENPEEPDDAMEVEDSVKESEPENQKGDAEQADDAMEIEDDRGKASEVEQEVSGADQDAPKQESSDSSEKTAVDKPEQTPGTSSKQDTEDRMEIDTADKEATGVVASEAKSETAGIGKEPAPQELSPEQAPSAIAADSATRTEPEPGDAAEDGGPPAARTGPEDTTADSGPENEIPEKPASKELPPVPEPSGPEGVAREVDMDTRDDPAASSSEHSAEEGVVEPEKGDTHPEGGPEDAQSSAVPKGSEEPHRMSDRADEEGSAESPSRGEDNHAGEVSPKQAIAPTPGPKSVNAAAADLVTTKAATTSSKVEGAPTSPNMRPASPRAEPKQSPKAEVEPSASPTDEVEPSASPTAAEAEPTASAMDQVKPATSPKATKAEATVSPAHEGEPGGSPMDDVEPAASPIAEAEPKAAGPKGDLEPIASPESEVERKPSPKADVTPTPTPKASTTLQASAKADVERATNSEGEVEQTASSEGEVEPQASPEAQVEKPASTEDRGEKPANPKGRVEQTASPEAEAERTASPEAEAERTASPEAEAERTASPGADVEQTASPEADAAEPASARAEAAPRASPLAEVTVPIPSPRAVVPPMSSPRSSFSSRSSPIPKLRAREHHEASISLKAAETSSKEAKSEAQATGVETKPVGATEGRSLTPSVAVVIKSASMEGGGQQAPYAEQRGAEDSAEEGTSAREAREGTVPSAKSEADNMSPLPRASSKADGGAVPVTLKVNSNRAARLASPRRNIMLSKSEDQVPTGAASTSFEADGPHEGSSQPRREGQAVKVSAHQNRAGDEDVSDSDAD